jgi:hypothetical protein
VAVALRGSAFGRAPQGDGSLSSVIGTISSSGAGHYVLHTFALTYLIAAIAVFLVGIETKGRVLEEITAAKPS